MKRKKTVGEIFRDQYKAVETTPPDGVWSRIELSLEKKGKRQLAIPFWYRVAGIAAMVAIMVGILLSPNPELAKPLNSEISESGLEPKFENTSENFNKIMNETSILLQDLTLRNKKFSSPGITQFENNDFPMRQKRELVTNLNVAHGKVINSSSPNISHSLAGLYLVKEKFEKRENVNNREIQPPDLKKEKKFLERLGVSTIAGIVYSDNLTKGSFLDKDLSSYNDQGEVSFSYGIKLSYELTERLNLRTGFSSVKLGYRTDDVAVSSAISAEAVDAEPLGLEYSFIGNLHQNIGLIEIPVEFSFALINRMVSLNLIAGASGLFIDSNSLSLEGSTSTLNLGAANNLNTVSISGNLGLGLNYRIQSNLHLTLEPIFKFQFNTFKSPSSGVAPYMMGLHSGLIYRF